MSLLRLDAVSRRALTRRVLDRVTLEVAEGECLVLLGQPGSGRAALLRVIAGLEEADEGRILLDGRDMTRLPARRRPVGHVFQHDPLYGHATVFDCVARALPEAEDGAPQAGAPFAGAPLAGAPLASTPLAGVAARVQQLLGLVGLAEDAGSMPAMLPPGKRRRLMLARVLATDPRLLLVGEGFGAADPDRPHPAPRRWLREVQRRLGLTMILVAQGPEEALALADRIAVLEAGRVEQLGTPAELKRRPANAGVARLLGAAAVLPGPSAEQAPLSAGGLWLPAEALEVVAPGLGMPARVLGATMLGATVRLDLQLLADGRQLEAEVPSMGIGGALPAGSIIGIRLRAGTRMDGAMLN